MMHVLSRVWCNLLATYVTAYVCWTLMVTPCQNCKHDGEQTGEKINLPTSPVSIPLVAAVFQEVVWLHFPKDAGIHRRIEDT